MNEKEKEIQSKFKIANVLVSVKYSKTDDKIEDCLEKIIRQKIK